MPEYLSGELLARMKWKSTRRRRRAWRKRREDWGRLRSRDRADDPTDHISGSAQPSVFGTPCSIRYDCDPLGPWALGLGYSPADRIMTTNDTTHRRARKFSFGWRRQQMQTDAASWSPLLIRIKWKFIR